MSKLKTIISRTQLYERVWTTPMQKLAQEFGLLMLGSRSFVDGMTFVFPEEDIGRASSSVKSQRAHLYSIPKNFTRRTSQSMDVSLMFTKFPRQVPESKSSRSRSPQTD